MKKKRRFIFIETIVVIAVLLTSLLYLYASYIALTTNEKRRMLYDDVSYLYKTYYIKKYFVSQRLDRVIDNLSDENVNTNANFIIPFGCSSIDVFENYAKEGTFCELMSQNLHISNIYMTYYDLSAIQDCENNEEGLCATFSRVNMELATYLKTLGGSGISGYRMIVEYQEDGQGNFCTNEEHCLHYFSTIMVGDDI